ncbi:MAG: DUF2231 domain-containing protein [Elusimicrobia bacterium]|nr:DUF2231 domain-containing protein [Elusimicrobiota bacterium]
MPKPFLLHPAFVHFPIALLLTGLVGAGVSVWSKRWAWLADAVSWLLWLGTASAWGAMGLGLLAEKTAPHVPPAWETLATHKTLAYWTVGLFIVLSLWRRFFKDRWSRLFLLAWLGAATVLLATAYHGGELVFTHNMGTAASAE